MRDIPGAVWDLRQTGSSIRRPCRQRQQRLRVSPISGTTAALPLCFHISFSLTANQNKLPQIRISRKSLIKKAKTLLLSLPSLIPLFDFFSFN
jgi:hypothetical protein